MEHEQEMEEDNEVEEPPVFDERMVMETHLETLRNQVLIQITLYSKTKFSQALSDEQLIDAFKKRFGRTLPLNSVDCVFIEENPVNQ